MTTFRVGDHVVATGNYYDEQLGQIAPTDVQTVVEVLDNSQTSFHQLVKTNMSRGEWVDSSWFQLAKREGEQFMELLNQYEREQSVNVSSHVALYEFAQWLQKREDKKST